ncbi:MAG TPA: type II secretion system protein [Rhizomicrobium sp.]|jgi:general secretion pathway protein J
MGGDRGYALIEMLVSLALIGMMAAMMVEGIGTGRRVWEHIDTANNIGDQIAGAQILLRERIERLIPATKFDKIPSYADFDGKADSMVFLSPPRDAQQPNASMRYQLSLAANGDLVLAALSDVATPQAQPQQLVLLHNAQSVDIAYYGSAPPDNQPNWRFAWEQLPAPPQLIRIRVHFAPQDPRVWPELLIKPFATVDTMCVLIVRTGKCRGRA